MSFIGDSYVRNLVHEMVITLISIYTKEFVCIVTIKTSIEMVILLNGAMVSSGCFIADQTEGPLVDLSSPDIKRR